jgi:uncharacterized protein (DUF1778 family)
MATTTARSEKLDLRLTPSAKQKLQAAAREKERSVTDFVLQSALDRADEVLAEQRVFRMNAAQWEAFRKALDAPPRDIPELRKLLTEPSAIELSQKK